MHKINIQNLGPVNQCSFTIDDFCVMTGPQASGKSTIAKAVFFFRTIKDDIVSLYMKRASTPTELKRLKPSLEKQLRNKFLQIFGSSWGMDMEMELTYYYSEDTWATVKLKESEYPGEANYIYIDFSKNIYLFLAKCDTDSLLVSNEMRTQCQLDVNELFHDPYESVFIPAGRSMITLLTNQLSYIFSTMDDAQKRSIDYCTQNYIERILKIKPVFEYGMRGMYREKLMTSNERINKKLLNQVMDLIDYILKGQYRYVSGEERLLLNDHKYVKLNFTSSGQQESIWIYNLIFYYLLEHSKIFLILEEPESHLYPEAQKDTAELIALLKNAGNSAIVTTHSPYILGALNNLLYASKLGQTCAKDIEPIISHEKWLSPAYTSAYHIHDGIMEDIMDKELLLIKNEIIDEISQVINDTSEELMQIQLNQEEQ